VLTVSQKTAHMRWYTRDKPIHVTFQPKGLHRLSAPPPRSDLVDAEAAQWSGGALLYPSRHFMYNPEKRP